MTGFKSKKAMANAELGVNMNERIKKIIDSMAPDYVITNDWKERLVKAVAAECANICDDLKFTPEGPSHAAAYQRGLCGMEIRKAFDVPSVSRKKI